MASTVTFDLSGLTAHANRLRAASLRVGVEAAAVIHAGAEAAVREVRARCPVDEGEMRNSVGFDLLDAGLRAVIGPTDPAARFVEYGTSTVAPRPFVHPGVDAVRPQVAAALAAVMYRAMT